MIGKFISHYRVIGKLGQGGMGAVFLAEDTSLERKVALKFLPDQFTTDPERLTRFAREARLLASLNHPNIAAIHGLEQADGKQFIVMELAEGETLEKRMERAPVTLKEALEICRQIAEGLEAAQEKGIVHRDLKPANVMVSAGGAVKILDFGLAKALETGAATDLSVAPTQETGATVQGMIVGTAPYMSPEQARGMPLDTRTDVWSFGCLLYEMLARKRAFAGSTTTEVLARILEREPDWTQLPAVVPENIRCLLRRCLQKDPRCRLHSIGDARIELEETLAGRVGVAAGARPVSRRMIAAVGLAGLLLGISGAVLWTLMRVPAAAPHPVVRFAFDLPPDQPMKPTWNAQLMFSPDGRTLAYSHNVGDVETTVFRRLEELEAKPLAGTSGMTIPVFSPDGRYVLLMDPMQSALKKAAVSGGAPILFAGYDMAFRGDWALDNYYYWTTHYFGPIVRTPAAGGDRPEPVTELDLSKQERTHRHVQVLPGGKAIMFTVSTGEITSFDDARIDLYTLDTKKRRTLVQGGFSPRYATSGHIVYARGGGLYAVPFDAARLEVTGPPVKVIDGVFMSTNSGSAHFDISRTGALAYAVGKAEGGERTLVWVDRKGNATPLPLPHASYLFPRVSPVDNLIAFEIEGVNHDLYIYDPDRGVTTKKTTDGVSHAPVWTPNGKRIAFRSWKAGTITMWWMPSDGSAPEERLTMVGARQSVVSFSPDGRYLAYNQMDVMGAGDGTAMASGPETGATGIWILPMQGDRTPQRFAASKFIQGSGRFSPDGKWVAYCSTESLKNEVWVQPWPGPGPKTQISSEGGTDPIWSRNGRELFYRNGDKMMVVEVVTQPGFHASAPHELWKGRYAHGMSSSCGPPGTTEANYDVTGDGSRFLMVKDVNEDVVSTRIVVVLNFAEELKRLADLRK